MWKMDPMLDFDIRLVFTLPPRDSTLQYKRCVFFWNNFPCITSLHRPDIFLPCTLPYLLKKKLIKCPKLLFHGDSVKNESDRTRNYKGGAKRPPPILFRVNEWYTFYRNLFLFSYKNLYIYQLIKAWWITALSWKMCFYM